MKTFRVGGVRERVVERSDMPRAKLRRLLRRERVAVLGYGVQGRSQSLNMRDNGLDVVVGLRKGRASWRLALRDGWKPGKTLFSIREAAQRGTVVAYLLSDAGQKAQWGLVQRHLNEGDALYFSHGFSIVYSDQTGVVPPPHVDVIMVGPKGSGTTLRRNFVEGRGFNVSFAVEQDFTGQARERCIALGIGIGSQNLFETTFKKEVYCDLTGERGVLVGAIYGLWLAQYETLRERGHPPSEAFNETVEEATQSLYPLIGEHGMDWMYANCSTTAQRGALDWYRRFRDATKDLFGELYDSVANGGEARRVLRENSRSDYRKRLQKELKAIGDSEMWRVGSQVRALRPERASQAKRTAQATKASPRKRSSGKKKSGRTKPKKGSA